MSIIKIGLLLILMLLMPRFTAWRKADFFMDIMTITVFYRFMFFCNQQLLVSYLRPANIDGAKHSWAILSLLVKRFREEWPEVKIIFRADVGFCRWKMLRWCEKNEVKYMTN